jgi:hypothetical protein
LNRRNPHRRGRPRAVTRRRAGQSATDAAVCRTEQPKETGPVAASAGTNARKTSRRPGARDRERASAAPVKVLLAGQLERMLEDQPDGLSAAALAKLANASYRQVSALLAALEADGTVRRSGHGRGTRWHALDDEAWIARRAAELEQRSAKPPQHQRAESQLVTIVAALEPGRGRGLAPLRLPGFGHQGGDVAQSVLRRAPRRGSQIVRCGNRRASSVPVPSCGRCATRGPGHAAARCAVRSSLRSRCTR